MLDATPISHWIGFHLFILILLGVELLYVRHQGPSKTQSTSVAATILWIAAALAFALFLFRSMGGHSATQYLAGYAIEESLSVDNLFLFLLLFRVFKIEPANQPKALFWGVSAPSSCAEHSSPPASASWPASNGSATSSPQSCLSPPFASFSQEPKSRKPKRPAGSPGYPASIPSASARTSSSSSRAASGMITVLFLALIAIELTDVVFALDSIPAVLSITRHPFLAYTSNIMAVMGLRSLYFLLAHLLTKLRFLHYGLAGVLAFAAFKMLAAHWIEIGPLLSLAVIITILGITVVLSLLSKVTTQQS